MKQGIIIIFICILFIVAIGCFIGGIKYADKTSGIPKDDNFEIDGYFTNIQKSYSTIVDKDYPYFTKGTGASEAEAKDFNNHPEDYKEFTVELNVVNVSNNDVGPVWAVSPGYYANTESVTYKDEDVDANRKIWIYAWLSEGGTMIPRGEKLITHLHIIVKTTGMNDQEIQNLLMNTQVNLQVGICQKSLNPTYDISRSISFIYPVFYR